MYIIYAYTCIITMNCNVLPYVVSTFCLNNKSIIKLLCRFQTLATIYDIFILQTLISLTFLIMNYDRNDPIYKLQNVSLILFVYNRYCLIDSAIMITYI